MDRAFSPARQVGNEASRNSTGAPKERALRVLSDSMYDPADPEGSFMMDDIVMVDSRMEAKDGDFVVVSLDGGESLMKLAIEDGARVFRYTAPDKADVRFTDAEAVVTGVVVARHRAYVSSLSGPLKWSGDDIGLCNDRPIRVRLFDQDGRDHLVSLREALMVADQLDEYGRQRVTSALSFSADDGYLRPMDLAVWREFESDRLFIETGSISHA